MAAFEGSYANLLQGVSQQIARSRLPGQLTEQVNMLSDPVTGVRRRPGIIYQYSQDAKGAKDDELFGTYTDVAGARCHILINTKVGEITIREHDYSDPQTLQNDYLKATNAKYIRTASVGDSLYIANVEVVPQGVAASSGVSPDKQGFFFPRTSAFSKTYSITFSYNGKTGTVSYTTPDGTDASHAAQSTTEYIAQQLESSLNSWKNSNALSFLTVSRQGSYVYIRDPNATSGAVMSITSISGTQYLATSGNSYVRDPANLPSNLPSAANNYIVSTGPKEALVYYKYNSATQSWIESGDYGSIKGIMDMPIELYWDGSQWQLDDSDYEGRLSGDEKTNETPNFVDWGITGLTSYQGRLVILSGPWVSMSASNLPKRFFRSTVADLLDTDPIHIGSSAASSAAYEHAVPFNKDLILFSAGYQALIPSGSAALTPRNSQVVTTSVYATDTNATPIGIGRTLMYPAPRSTQYFGVMEMIPSPYTDSQYVSVDSTEHLPKYLKGKCRFIVSSSVASMVLFGQTGDYKSIVLHEYTWAGEDKVLKSWHKWNFKHTIACAYFSNEVINVVSIIGGNIHVGTIDPKADTITDDQDTRPFLDWNFKLPVTDYEFTVPAGHREVFLQDDDLTAAISGGGLGGEPIGVQYNSSTGEGTLHHSFTGSEIFVGLEYESLLSPTPPVLLDDNEIPIASGKLTVLRFFVLLQNSGKFNVEIQDLGNASDKYKYQASPIKWSSPDLALGKAPISGEGSVVVPCRTNAPSTRVDFKSHRISEMNIVALEYVCRYNQRIKRR